MVGISSRIGITILASLLLVLPLLVACNSDKKTPSTASTPTTASESLVAYTEERQPCDCRSENKNLYFGDLHAHTRLSFDAYAHDLRVSPARAYEFAKGAEVALPPLDAEGNGTRMVKLSRPLDFVAITDHHEFIAEVYLCTNEDSSAYNSPACQKYREGGDLSIADFGMRLAALSPVRSEEICGETGVNCQETAKEIWQTIIQNAENAYDRSSNCTFTAFPAYEYTGAPRATNNHRNVIFRNAQVPELPPSFFEQPTEQGLWTELNQICLNSGNGCDCIAIPHNSNMSNGNMFMLDYPEGMSIEEQRDIAAFRAKMEPLVEIHQYSGNMECKNGFEGIPYDPLCDFEKIHGTEFEDCGDIPGEMGMAGFGCISKYDYIRNVLKLGLSEMLRLGVNPYKLGIIGDTDTHNGTPGNTEEYSFPGHSAITDDTALKRLGSSSMTSNSIAVYNPGGLTAVWAVENSRDALFDSFRAREVYATSGTRITVRFFGGWDYPADLCENPEFVSIGYQKGVPIGSDLRTIPEETSSPTFAIMAEKDPGTEDHPGTDLQQIQIIKGWIDSNGLEQEKVFLVAGDPNNGSGVNSDTCQPVGEGWDQLCTLWTDPEFDPDNPAFYYVRVIENPSCSWRQYDCNSLAREGFELPEACSDPTLHKVIQERSITSPIWYTP